VSSINHGRCTGRAQHDVRLDDGRQPIDRGLVGASKTYRPHIGLQLTLFKLSAARKILPGWYGDVQLASRFHSGFAAIRIDHEVRVDKVAMSFQQPLNAIRVPACLLVSRECYDHIACGSKVFLLQAYETHGHGRVLATATKRARAHK